VSDAEQRASQLAQENPGSGELLRFAAGLLKAQASLRAADLAGVAAAARRISTALASTSSFSKSW